MKTFAKKIENILKKQEMDTEKWYVFKYCSHIPDSTLFYPTFSISKESPPDKVSYLKDFLEPLFKGFQNCQFTVTIFIKKMPISHSFILYSYVKIDMLFKNRRKDIKKVDILFTNKNLPQYIVTFREGLCKKSKLKNLPTSLRSVSFFGVVYKRGLIEIKTGGGFSTNVEESIRSTYEILKNADKIVSYFSSVII